MREIAVVGLGNAHRGDDAAGLLAVERLRNGGESSLETFQSAGDVTELMDLFQSFRTVYVVDALASPSAAIGAVVRVEGNACSLPLACAQSSTHAFGLGELVELARTLGALPPRLVIFGINGRHFGMGEEVSREVSAAVNAVAEEILCEIRERRGESETKHA